MKKIICLLLVLISVYSIRAMSNNETIGNDGICSLEEYKIASSSDIMMIDLSNQDCSIVSNDIMEYSELLVLDITGKKLESQEILSAFPNLIALNAEYSNINTLEYISTNIEDLYVAYSDISSLSTLHNYHLSNYSFDYLRLDNESREILRNYDANSKLIPMMTLIVNGEIFDNTYYNVFTETLVNELVVECDGNDTYELHVINNNTNEEVMLNNGVFELDTKQEYIVSYGNDEYQDSRVISFILMEEINPITTKKTIVIPPYVTPNASNTEDNNDVVVEENVHENEDVEEIESEDKLDILEEPVIEEIYCGAK